MKIQSKSTKLFVIPALLVVAIILSTAVPGRAQKVSPQVQDNSIGYSTGLIGIAPGQSVRLAAVNESNLTIPFQFRIVDDQGFPLIQDDGFVPPGNAVYRDFEFEGNFNGLKINGQVRVGSDKELKELAPSLQVIDAASGKTVSVLSSGNFRSFSKMFNPPTSMLGMIQEVSPQVQDNSIGYSPGLIGITAGQILRVVVVNEGNLTIPFQFRIVDDQGFPQIQDNGFVPPGKSAFIEFEYFGKGDRLELNAQVRAGSDKALKELNPSLHVIDTASGKTLSVLGGGNFNSFTKMFDPPQQF
jgi:hypothetical protein